MSKGSFRDRMKSSGSRPGTLGAGARPKQFYCTVFGQMDRSQTNLAVVLRTYFYPKEQFKGNMKSIEERWDENPSFKIICNHEVNSDPPSVMLCNPVCVKAKPGAQFRIDLENQEAFLDTSEFFVDGPQLPKCLQFDISLQSYNIKHSISPGAQMEESASSLVPSIKIIRSPDETQVATIPLVHLCDIPDAAMTGSFAFDDFCYTIDPAPRFGIKCDHNRTWHRLPQLLIKFMSEDRALASKVMEIAKEWEKHAGLQLIHIPKDANRDAQIRVKFSSRNQSAIGTDAEDIPDDRATLYLNVARDTHPVLFRRRVLHQFGHALGLNHEFESLPESVEWDEAGVQLDTSMEAGWSSEQTKRNVFNKETCSNNDNFDRLSIMTQTFKRAYIKGWLPRQHQSVLSEDDKAIITHLYPPPHETHQWADPLASPEPEEEEEDEESEEEEEEDMTEWKKAIIDKERGTPIDMFAGVFSDQAGEVPPPTPPASGELAGVGRKHRSLHARQESEIDSHKRVIRMQTADTTVEYEPTDDGKKRLVKNAASIFEFEPDFTGKKIIRPSTDGKSFLEYQEPKYTKEEIQSDIREGDFFSFRDQAAIRDMDLVKDDRIQTPLFSPPDTPDSIPDSLAASPVSKLFLSDNFMDIREDWLNVDQEHMICITHESIPGTRKQKAQLHPGDIRYTDGPANKMDFRGNKIQEDTYGYSHKEKELFGERTNLVSPTGIVEREAFYKTLNKLSTGETEEFQTFQEKMKTIEKENAKHHEFYKPKPEREFVGEADIQGMGFDAPQVRYRNRGKQVEYEPTIQASYVQQVEQSVEYEPGQKPKGKGKGKKPKVKQQLKTVDENEDSFYNMAFKKAQHKEEKEEAAISFREKLKYREGIKAPIQAGLSELQPVDEDIFDLLDRCQKESHHMGRGKFSSTYRTPALISTKGSFAGIGGSGSFRETGWQSYYDYAEDDMMDYEYREKEEDQDMDLMSFRQRLQKRSGVAIHEGVEISPAAQDHRNYLESPVPVMNRSHATEDKISKAKSKRHDGSGKYYDDHVDLISPQHLIDESLDRGFKLSKDHQNESEDDISREKREAARRHYGMRGSTPPDDDVEQTKDRIKQQKKSQKDSRERSEAGSQSRDHKKEYVHEQQIHHEQYQQQSSEQKMSRDERKRFGFEHTVNLRRDDKEIQDGHKRDYRQENISRKSSKQGSPEISEVSVEADLNWNLDRTHLKKSKQSNRIASDMFQGAQKVDEDDDCFLPPIMPKKQKSKSKAFVKSKEIATQITADALIPQQPIGDFWISKDTIINRGGHDIYDDMTVKVPSSTDLSASQKFYMEQERPATYRSTFTAYEPPSEAYEKPQFDALSDEGEEGRDVYTRLTDSKTYTKDSAATEIWTQKTDISFTVLLYLKKNLGINWKRAGQYLGISRERLRRIEDVGIASARTGIEKMAQDMLFEWAEKDPQPTVAKLCAALEAADLSKLAQGVFDKVNKEKQHPVRRGKKTSTRKGTRGRKVDDPVKVPVSEETIPYRVMVYLKDNLGESWKDVAICLKVPSQRIKSIEADAWQVEKMAYDMLHEWRQREKESATVDKLIEALEKAQCKKLVKGVQARSQSYHFRVSG